VHTRQGIGAAGRARRHAGHSAATAGAGERFVTFDGIAKACAEAMGTPEPEIIHFDPKAFDFGKKKPFPMRDGHFFASIDKAKKDLGWAPAFGLVDGLRDSFEKARAPHSHNTPCCVVQSVSALCALGHHTRAARAVRTPVAMRCAYASTQAVPHGAVMRAQPGPAYAARRHRTVSTMLSRSATGHDGARAPWHSSPHRGVHHLQAW
jgi:hypothetical protein